MTAKMLNTAKEKVSALAISGPLPRLTYYSAAGVRNILQHNDDQQITKNFYT